MGKSMLKHRSWERILTFVLAFAMLAACLPAGVAWAAEETADSNVHVLDVEKDLAAFAAGDKAAGSTTEIGGFFTILWSEKSKVDTSSKSWDDGYSSGLRINSSEKAQLDRGSIMFKTAGPATVKIWWAKNGDDARQMVILDSTGGTVDITTGEHTKNSAYLDTLTIDDAGTYYLGGDINGNYIFKVEVTEAPASSTYVLDAEKDLTAFAAGEKAVGSTTEAGGYFTILWSDKSKVDTSSKKWDDDYSSGQRINFGGKASTQSNSIMFKTAGPATVKIWWVQGGDDNREMGILNGDGAVVTQTSGTYTKNDPYLSTLELAEAGTWYLGGVSNNNYIFKVEVTTGGGTVERAPWAEAAAPAITEAKQDKGNIEVTVSALVGADGADQVTVTMTKPDGSKESKDSLGEKSEHSFTFTPTASGDYTFSVTAIRDGEETEHTGAETKAVAFVLPLAAPNVKSATNNGDGSVKVEWDPVPEATGYKVTVTGADKSAEAAECSATIEGLTIGTEYTFNVVAVRGSDESDAGSIKCTVRDQKEVTWAFVSYGPSASTSKNSYSGSAYDDGGVTLVSTDNGGKIQNTVDGLGFYYTVIDPKTTNFTLSATVKVNSWEYNNGQEGFGLMAADIIGAHGDTGNIYNNSYMAVATKVEYLWDTENDRLSAAGDTKVAMYLGFGAREIVGVTKENKSAPGDALKYTMVPLEHAGVAQGGGNFNIVGNVTNPDGLDKKAATIAELTEFKLTIQKNNTGYFISYTDADGHTETKKFYDPEALSVIDEDHVYVGFFAARNADVSFTDVVFTSISKEEDDPAEERPIEYTDPNYSIVSSSNSTKAEYQLAYYGNADGAITVKDSEGNVLTEDVAVKANVKTYVPVTLKEGANTFMVTMTPDKNYLPDGEYSSMRDYDPWTKEFTVNYEADTRDVVYVGPNGTASAEGTREDPATIYEAVRKATPGQKIILLSGTYDLSSTVTIQRGIDGTADAMIQLIADPDGETRPVLDFGAKCEGIVLAANYWHFYGFDVTNSADLKDGVRVSGSNNVIERLLTYKNGNTGIQISRYAGSDLKSEWPANNLILNCSSYLNADGGYEDADGFAAKLTIGEGNVFDGCIAAYNADDGWDLFAKLDTGPIGAVTIRNCVAFKNGYILDDSGNEISAGNGNGFKMGGSNLAGAHMLINSVSFGNKAKGIDSNSGLDIKVTNSTSFDNESYNVAFYTNVDETTGYAAQGIISYKKTNAIAENIKPKGSQTVASLEGSSNYYFDGSVSVNSKGVQVTDGWFVHVDMDKAISGTAEGIGRNADGSINMNGFLVLTNMAPADAGARLSAADWLNLFTDVSEANWFGGDVAYVVQNGLMIGVGNGKFNPGGTTTRGTLMTILARMDGVSTGGSTPWYQAGLEWAMREGISDGANPEEGITREQFAVMLWRFAGKPAVTGDLSAYPDVGDIHRDWAGDAMIWAVQTGIVRGSGGKLNPQNIATRSEAAAMLTRFCQNIEK